MCHHAIPNIDFNTENMVLFTGRQRSLWKFTTDGGPGEKIPFKRILNHI